MKRSLQEQIQTPPKWSKWRRKMPSQSSRDKLNIW